MSSLYTLNLSLNGGHQRVVSTIAIDQNLSKHRNGCSQTPERVKPVRHVSPFE